MSLNSDVGLDPNDLGSMTTNLNSNNTTNGLGVGMTSYSLSQASTEILLGGAGSLGGVLCILGL